MTFSDAISTLKLCLSLTQINTMRSGRLIKVADLAYLPWHMIIHESHTREIS